MRLIISSNIRIMKYVTKFDEIDQYQFYHSNQQTNRIKINVFNIMQRHNKPVSILLYQIIRMDHVKHTQFMKFLFELLWPVN